MDDRVSYVCKRAGQLRKGKTVAEFSQHDAFVQANKEYNQKRKKTFDEV